MVNESRLSVVRLQWSSIAALLSMTCTLLACSSGSGSWNSDGAPVDSTTLFPKQGGVTADNATSTGGTGIRDAAMESITGSGGNGGETPNGGITRNGGEMVDVGGATVTGGIPTASGGVVTGTGDGATIAGGSVTTGDAGMATGGAKGTGGAAAWNSPSNGNPFLPGYFADPSIIYDEGTKTFYVVATTDGNWISFSSEPVIWYSTNFVHWKSHPLTLPSTWPTKPLWAPSIMKHPTNGQYYLLFAGGGTGTYIARSASPLGPWENATTGTTSATAALYKAGAMWGNNDWIDAQFFVDGTMVYMTFGGSGTCGIAILTFAADLSVAIDNTDVRMTNGTLHKFKKLVGLTNFLEGSVMFKNGTQYFVAYSSSACQNYNVQYAAGNSPVGPFIHANELTVQRDNAKNILGPGHHSVFQYGNDWYLVYHRQHYPYVDVKRQTAINRFVFSGGIISASVQTQEGVFAGSGALETFVSVGRTADETDLAFSKPVLASSESDYKGGTSGNIKETFPAVKGFYAARYAVDHNHGTRWASTTLPGSLIVDLGADQTIGRCETTFEYVLRVYKYRIEYLAQAEAADLSAAQAMTTWHLFADRSANTAPYSPIVDMGPATARYLKITLLSANLPTASAEINTIVQTDYADRASIVEFKAFKASSAP